MALKNPPENQLLSGRFSEIPSRSHKRKDHSRQSWRDSDTPPFVPNTPSDMATPPSENTSGPPAPSSHF